MVDVAIIQKLSEVAMRMIPDSQPGIFAQKGGRLVVFGINRDE